MANEIFDCGWIDHQPVWCGDCYACAACGRIFTMEDTRAWTTKDGVHLSGAPDNKTRGSLQVKLIFGLLAAIALWECYYLGVKPVATVTAPAVVFFTGIFVAHKLGAFKQ